MKKRKTNLLIVGLLKTGSSALIDLLQEYDNINLIPGEFDDFRAPGLVSDQLINSKNNAPYYDISKLTSFKSQFKKIYEVYPISYWSLKTINKIGSRFRSSIFRIKQLNLLKKFNKILSSNISIEDKIEYANQWITATGNINNGHHQFVLYNNALEVVNDIDTWKKVFRPSKLIIVFRDPKDQLADIIKNNYLYAPFGSPRMNFGGVTLETIYGRDRKAAINFHIDAIKKRYEWIESLKKELDSNELLLIDFEGLIKNYKLYKTIIENFIGNSATHHKHQKIYFDPKNAEECIGIFKNYLNEDELNSLIPLEKKYQILINSNLKQQL